MAYPTIELMMFLVVPLVVDMMFLFLVVLLVVDLIIILKALLVANLMEGHKIKWGQKQTVNFLTLMMVGLLEEYKIDLG